jgi:hypothetical protein
VKASVGGIPLLAALMAAGTWLIGWSAVIVVVVAWQLLRRETPAWHAAIAAPLGWGVLLLLIPLAPLGRLTGRLAGIFHLPPGVLIAVVLLYAALLGWCAARVVRGFAPGRIRPSSSQR